MLTSATGATSATLSYDPALRLYQVSSGGTTTRFGYDGLNLIAEYNGSNAILRRYVHRPGMDQPLVQYEGAGMATRRFLHADERGSIIAVSDASGNTFAKNSYDEYGLPQNDGSGNNLNYGRFQYTGQVWLPELAIYHYKARMYSPTLGRFLQTDPIGYGDGLNLYAYVKNDPVNFVDPSGLGCQPGQVQSWAGSSGHWDGDTPVITANYLCFELSGLTTEPRRAFGEGGGGGGGGGGGDDVCSKPLSGDANRGETVNSRRAQVRREIMNAIKRESRTSRDTNANLQALGRNTVRLTPNVGTWIKGGTSKPDGNYLYGAVTKELGIPLSVSLPLADFFEYADDIIDRLTDSDPDEAIGNVDQESADQIREGAQCPG